MGGEFTQQSKWDVPSRFFPGIRIFPQNHAPPRKKQRSALEKTRMVDKNGQGIKESTPRKRRKCRLPNPPVSLCGLRGRAYRTNQTKSTPWNHTFVAQCLFFSFLWEGLPFKLHQRKKKKKKEEKNKKKRRVQLELDWRLCSCSCSAPRGGGAPRRFGFGDALKR